MLIGRREFIGTAAMTAGGLLAGCGTVPTVAKKAKDDFIWAALFHMGTNMWCDQVPDSWGPFKGEELKLICAADHLRFDEKVWRSLLKRLMRG